MVRTKKAKTAKKEVGSPPPKSADLVFVTDHEVELMQDVQHERREMAKKGRPGATDDDQEETDDALTVSYLES